MLERIGSAVGYIVGSMFSLAFEVNDILFGPDETRES